MLQQLQLPYRVTRSLAACCPADSISTYVETTERSFAGLPWAIRADRE